MNENFKVGFVSIIGRPNVGKSTLLNYIIGQKIAITSKKPQTTRNNLNGIYTIPEKGQIVFVDTPGLHKPHHLLGEQLIKKTVDSLEDIDAILLLVDGTEEPGGGDKYILDNFLKDIETPVFLLVNKIDRIQKKDKDKFFDKYKELYNFKKSYLVSAKHGDSIQDVLNELIEILPEGQPYYEEDFVTDIPTRDIAGELIREQIFRLLGDELPHSSAVFIESFKDDAKKKISKIKATIYVERDSQKGMIIGKGGSKLKEIGTNSRIEIEKLIGNKVFLDLHVKVMKNWRKNQSNLKKLGYIVD